MSQNSTVTEVLENSRLRAETALKAIEQYQHMGKNLVIDHYKDILAAYGFGWKSNNGGVHIYFEHCNLRVNLWPTTHRINITVGGDLGGAKNYQGVDSVIEKLHQIFNDTY